MAEFVLTVPEQRSAIERLRVNAIHVAPLGVTVSLDAIGGDGAVARAEVVSITATPPTTAASIAFLLALTTARPGESGGVLSRANYRILGHLADLGLLTGGTVVAG